MTESGTTYWHIAYDGYQPGDALLCRNDQTEIDTPWKWGEDAEEGFDGNVVCLFPDTPRGWTEADWLWYEHPTYHPLRIDLPGGDYPVTEVDEGYPAVDHKVPGEYVT